MSVFWFCFSIAHIIPAGRLLVEQLEEGHDTILDNAADSAVDRQRAKDIWMGISAS